VEGVDSVPGSPGCGACGRSAPGARIAAWVSVSSAVVSLLLVAASLLWFTLVDDTAPSVLPPAGEVLSAGVPLVFALVGDNRKEGEVFENILAAIKRSDARFIMHGGDLVHRCNPRQYRWLLHELDEAALPMPFCAVPGNHDIDQDLPTVAQSYELYCRAFGPRRYWFACGNALFVAFDDAAGEARPDELAWLEQTLSLHRDRYRACFVYMHVPPVDPRPDHARRVSVGREELVQILVRHHVTAVFASHIHAYVEASVAGIPVYITGGAGADLDEPETQFHYVLCTVEADGSLKVQKVDVPALPDADNLEYLCRTNISGERLLALALVAGVLSLATGVVVRRGRV